MVALSYFNPPGYSSMGVVNTPLWRPPRSLDQHPRHGRRGGPDLPGPARARPPPLAGLLAEATSPQSEGFCPVLGEEVTFGLGFKPTTPRRPFGPNPSAFGHFGTGGAVGSPIPMPGWPSATS